MYSIGSTEYLEGCGASSTKSRAQANILVFGTAHLEAQCAQRHNKYQGDQRRYRLLLWTACTCYQDAGIP